MKMSTARLWVYRIVTAWLPETKFFGLKRGLLRWCGVKVGCNVRINSSARFSGDGKLEIGDDVWIGPCVHIGSCGKATVFIGNHVDVAPHVCIWTGSHKIDVKGLHIAGEGYNSSIRINDGCWVGMCSCILPGVCLASRTIVAAGSVVANSVHDQLQMIAGVPATIRKGYK